MRHYCSFCAGILIVGLVHRCPKAICPKCRCEFALVRTTGSLVGADGRFHFHTVVTTDERRRIKTLAA